MYFTTMITQGVSYRYGNHWRACAAPVSRGFVAGRMAVVQFAAAVAWHMRAVVSFADDGACMETIPSHVLPHYLAATAAKSAGKTSQGGAVWPPGQPADIKSGRLVFNANIHGTVFNTAAGKQTLAQFLDRLRINTASVFPRTTFGRMVLEGGSGLRLVNDPAYPCACESALKQPTGGAVAPGEGSVFEGFALGSRGAI